jgi:hypothetical protein
MLVKAENDDEALEKAESAYDFLIETGQGGHDYYTIFNSEKDHQYETSGSGRWGEQNNPIKVDSKLGKEILAEYLKYVTDDITDKFTKIKDALANKTQDEILDNMMDLYYFSSVDLERESNVNNHIYKAYDDSSFSPIFTQKQLNKALDEKYTHIVLADVHY